MRARLIAAALVVGAAVGCETGSKPANTAASSFIPPTSGVRTLPLAAGASLPLIQAEGWINGNPKAPGEPGVKLLVVDVHAPWCGFCEAVAPQLVELHTKYADRGVAFVSLTNLENYMMDRYIRKGGGIRWPCGYGATPQMLADLGAGSGMPGPYYYEAAPTLYVVGADGKVRWHDSRGRQTDIKGRDWATMVDEAIAAGLAEADAPKPDAPKPDAAPKRE